MKVMKKISFIIIISIMLSGCYDMRPVEELGIIVGLGYDVENPGMNYKYKDTSETFIFKGEKKIEHDTLSGKNKAIYTTKHEVQSKFNKKWILGTEIVYLIGQGRAEYGIKDLIDALIRDPERRVVAGIAVSKPQAESIYKMKPIEYSTMAEEIRGILNFSSRENFFTPKVEIPEFLQMYYQEGRKIVIPYMDEVDGRIQITGLALFKEDKMINKVDLDEAMLINLLRNTGGKSYLAVNSPETNEYYVAYFTSKVKVKVSKEYEKLKYDVFVNLSGDLKVDTVDKKMIIAKEVKEIQEVFSKNVETRLNSEVKKMQKEYKTDWLDFGKYAVAKYGRQGTYASDETFCNANIDVHVNTKISAIGQKKK